MTDLAGLTEEQFKSLPLVIEGESKEIRYAGQGRVVIRFKPTIYSFTSNRCATVEGSDTLRLRASRLFLEVLQAAGIRHAYRQVTDRWVLADLILPHPVEFRKYGLPPFTPPDLSAAEIARLPLAPPIEIIVKQYLTGTTKHNYVGLEGSRVRAGHPFYAGLFLTGEEALPEMLVRFDWRNPLAVPGRGRRAADQVLQGLESLEADSSAPEPAWLGEVRARLVSWADRTPDQMLPEQLADLFIDVARARRTAFFTARVIADFLAGCDIVFYDLCLFIDEAGETVYGELSPDCGRFRHLDLGSLDKDVWRSGGSSAQVLEKWKVLVELMERRRG
jgi:phosphoribosylaminoimidazole-succinocarboxamide synthase